MIKSFITSTGQPITPTKRAPSYIPTRPDTPRLPAATPITIPGIPSFPIVPRVVPNPGNEPDIDDEETPPGVIVQIPEAGIQLRYSPDGVTISNYTNPEVKERKAPVLSFPNSGKAATPPCCESETPEPPPNKDDEIICRIKTLQEEILDDGYDFRNGNTPVAQSGFYEEFDVEFFKVKIQVTQTPINLRIQSSNAPAQDVWFVGWFSWVEGGFPGERMPLHFESSNFIAPPGVTGFMYQLNQACAGFGQYRIRTKREYVDAC